MGFTRRHGFYLKFTLALRTNKDLQFKKKYSDIHNVIEKLINAIISKVFST